MRRLGDPSFNRLGIKTVPWGLGKSLESNYIRKVLTGNSDVGYDPSSLIGFWPQNELSGAISIDHSGLEHDGIYTAVALGQPGVPGMGMTSALFDGATSFNNIYSVGLNADFNNAAGTLLQWAKVSGVGVYTDGVNRLTAIIGADGTNKASMRKHAVNNRLFFRYVAGGVDKGVTLDGITETGWMRLAITWNKPDDEVIAYFDGIQTGAIQVGLGVWVGALSNTLTVIGAGSTVPAFPWSGNIGPVMLYNEALTPAEILYLSTV